MIVETVQSNSEVSCDGFRDLHRDSHKLAFFLQSQRYYWNGFVLAIFLFYYQQNFIIEFGAKNYEAF